MSDSLKPEFSVHCWVCFLLPYTDNGTGAGLNTHRRMVQSWRKQYSHRNYVFAVTSCIIFWPYLDRQAEEFNETLVFNNCNIVNLATRKVFKVNQSAH